MGMHHPAQPLTYAAAQISSKFVDEVADEAFCAHCLANYNYYRLFDLLAYLHRARSNHDQFKAGTEFEHICSSMTLIANFES